MNTLHTLTEGKGTVVDVRSKEEYRMGHVRGSINTPLPEVAAHIDEFRAMETPLVLCCASGNRSGIAAMMLQREGIPCINGGGWMDVDYALSLTKAS
jgi:rhodanese-related sulfurtransferase